MGKSGESSEMRAKGESKKMTDIDGNCGKEPNVENREKENEEEEHEAIVAALGMVISQLDVKRICLRKGPIMIMLIIKNCF